MTRDPAMRWAAPTMALAGLLLVLGGQLHPRGSLDEDFETLESHLLADAARWDATHAVLAAGIVLLTVGLTLLWRSAPVRGDRVLTTCTGLAIVGALIALAEMGVHIAMTSESAALARGGPTPLFDAHIVLQAAFTPLLCAGLIGIAVRGGLRRVWGGPLIAVIGTIGALAFGLSGPVVALHPDSHDALLFIGIVPIGLWAFLCGVQVLWRERRTRRRPSLASGSPQPAAVPISERPQ